MSDEAENITPTAKDPNAISDAVPRRASKKSVDKALDILRNRSRKNQSKRKKEPTEKAGRVLSNCCVMSYTYPLRRICIASSFSRSFSSIELRNAMRSEDWVSLLRILIIFLKHHYAEPPIWKFLFLIHLASPVKDQFEFEEFLKACLGCDNCDPFLEKILSLQIPNEGEE